MATNSLVNKKFLDVANGDGNVAPITMSTALKEISLSELTLGSRTVCDILDQAGTVLMRKGLILNQSVLDAWIRRGISQVLMSEPEATDGSSPNKAETVKSSSALSSCLLQPYDPVLFKQLEQTLQCTVAAIDEVVFALVMKETPETTQFEATIDKTRTALGTDDGAVLSYVNSQKMPPGKQGNRALATRSFQMSVLGLMTAMNMQMSDEECHCVALAGLLHDMSLFEEPLAILHSEHKTPEERQEVIFRHAIHSADFFSRSPGVTDLVRVIISQVHEQVDGTGFPRNLQGHQVNILGRVLNIVDAFLTLIEPQASRTAYIPADALAYLVHHTNQGVFDLACMKAFLKSMSIYAVGSKVALDDERVATVLRSTQTDLMRPVIQIDTDPNSIIDMRESDLTIMRPVVDPNFDHRQRLRKSTIDQVQWKPLFA